MSNLIPLSEDETVKLMQVSGGRPLCLGFGPSQVRLKARESPWAVPLLLEWRGITVNDGAGI